MHVLDSTEFPEMTNMAAKTVAQKRSKGSHPLKPTKVAHLDLAMCEKVCAPLLLPKWHAITEQTCTRSTSQSSLKHHLDCPIYC